MIKTGKMQKPMNQEMGNMFTQRNLRFGGFLRSGFEGDHNIAERRRFRHIMGSARGREGEHIGWLSDAAPLLIELCDEGIVAQEYANFAVWVKRNSAFARRGKDSPLGKARDVFKLRPLLGRKGNVDNGRHCRSALAFRAASSS